MKTISIIAVLLLAFQTHAQQDPQYTQYMYNMNIVNPAYAGSKKVSLLDYYIELNGLVLMEPLIQEHFLGTHLWVIILGIGLSVIADQIGPVKKLMFMQMFLIP